MADFNIEVLLETQISKVWDAWCKGSGAHASAAQWHGTIHLLFRYRGLFVRHSDNDICGAEAGQVLLCNAGKNYRIAHPAPGSDSSLVVSVKESMLRELAPPTLLHDGERLAFRRERLRIHPRAQAAIASSIRVNPNTSK